MRFSVIFSVCLLPLLFAIGNAEEQLRREKRFLKTDFLNPLSDSLLGLSDYARDLTDQLTAQTSMAVQNMMPQMSRTIGGLAPIGTRRREDIEKTAPKRGIIRVPLERETEGDEKEIEVFNPVKVEQPRRPTLGGGNDEGGIFSIGSSGGGGLFGEGGLFGNRGGILGGSGGGGGPQTFIPFSFSFGLLTPWWEGPNVCVERSEVEEAEQETLDFPGGFSINFESTRCIPSESTYVCTKRIQTNGVRKTFVVRRQCCHGFIRRTDGRPGCSALKMENLIDTMKSLEMGKFVQWLEYAGLKDKLQTENYTVFTPSNEAIVDFEDDTEDNEISAINPAKRLQDVSGIVASHIVEGFVNIDILENEQLLSTLDEESKIRINKYHSSHEMVTANCIPVSGKNNFATNGMIHLTSGVLPQPKETVWEIIDNDENFSTFRKLLVENGLLDKLKKQDEPWTLFVPTNEAFRKLPRSLKKQLESGEGCVENIIDQHIVKGTICTPAITSQLKVKNILDNSLALIRDEDEKLRVAGALIDAENNLGTNGVIHTIDKVLIPPQARSLLQALEEEERKDLIDLMELADLLSDLEEMQNVTFFVPTREALQNLPNDTRQELENNPELLKKLLQHHLIDSHTPTSMFSDNKKLTTVNGQNIHMKLHEIFPGLVTSATVQCAFVVSHDTQACGAVIHKINKVLIPPKGSIIETLNGMDGHDIVIKLLQNTELEKKLEEDGPFTFLAPTDDAFERMSDMSLEELLENKTKAEEILKLHVLPEVLCCNDVHHGSPFHRQYVRTLSGSILPLHRGLGDKVRFGTARATQCDVSATNGLVHSINRVILTEKPNNMFRMNLWPFF